MEFYINKKKIGMCHQLDTNYIKLLSVMWEVSLKFESKYDKQNDK